MTKNEEMQKLLAEHLFSTLFQHACLVTCFHSCTVRDGCTTAFWLAQGRRAKSPSVKSFHSHPHIIMLSCVFWVARALH